MSLDATPTAGQSGHIDDHGTLHQLANDDLIVHVAHGATASTARPTVAGTAAVAALWDGSVDPDNKVEGDLWWDTAAGAIKRYDGTVWVDGGGVTLEEMHDDLGDNVLQAGTSMSISYDDGTDTITFDVVAADFATAGHEHDLTISGTSSTSYTFAITDAGVFKQFTANSAVTATVPTNASVDFDDGEEITVFADGDGTVTVVGDSGVTVKHAGTISPGQVGVLVHDSGDTWKWIGPTADPVDHGLVVVPGTVDTTGEVFSWHIPHAMTVTDVFASVASACSTGTLTVDIHESGTSILSTKLTFDAGEKTTDTAATAAVISDPDLAQYAEISYDVDDAGDSTATGLVVWLIGERA